MKGTTQVLTYAGVTVMTLFGLGGGLFAAGYAIEDLGLAVGLAMMALWAVPTVVLAVLAVRRPDVAAPLLVGLTVLVGGFSVLDAALRLLDRDTLGPVTAMTVLALAVVLGYLALRRVLLAGGLLVLLALVQLTATAVGAADELGERADGTGRGVLGLLTTSSGVVVLPVLLVGLVFTVAGLLGRDPLRLPHPPRPTRRAH